MNILWIEDFGGLQAGKNILNQMFGDLLGFDAWNNDLFSLKTKPSDLNEFCTQQKSLHTIYLCRNYFDYAEFKENHTILNEIDAVIIDVRLDNGEHVDLEKDAPAPYTDKSKFHENGGFYIFNDLIHLGVSAEKMCFMTAETSTVKGFEDKCTEIYMPKVTAFEKIDVDYKELRKWLAEQELPYTELRRGIIEGCQYVKKLVGDKLYFNEYIKKNERIKPEDILNYLDVTENFLPLREPIDKTALYKLFIRTLSHEWEAADSIRTDKNKKDATLAWVMRNTRHWITHNSNLFSDLDEKMVAYLFIVNLRVMFNSDDDTLQCYEKILLNLFAEDALSDAQFKTINGNKLIPISKAYLDINKIVQDEKRNGILIQDAFYFNELANNIQLSSSSLRNDKQLFTKLLYQMFWLSTSNPYIDKSNKRNFLEIKFWDFNYAEKPYLNGLARHIYNASFSEA